MNFSDLFDFKNRVQRDTVMISDMNGVHDERLAKKGFNWLGALFMYFYVLFSEKYNVHGFGKKMVIIYFVWNLLVCVLSIISPIIALILIVVGFIWIGLMFDTWFRDQLIISGYTEKETPGFRTQQIAQPVQPKPLPQQTRHLMACPNCHEMIPDGIQFCTNCGANVAQLLQAQPKSVETQVACLNCHTLNPAGAKFCVSCGSDLQQLLAEQAKQAQQAPAEVTCPSCQTTNPANAKFCVNCGVDLVKTLADQEKQAQQAPIEVECPKCQTMNQAGAKFCVQCGFNFKAPTEKVCPDCQMAVPIAGKFCPGCGHAFRD
jgi:RNA polymerase subunit RPABC4/transcription elongation factor Spt4